jgi:hydroxymethylpyrimidine pyrophosphatase-like HAD family hydrolase
MRGTIALDIDGTITVETELSSNVIAYFKSLVDNGWRLIFITGRTFQSGYKTLKSIPFTYYFAVQNGAIILEMPSKRIVSKKYLDRSILAEMSEICFDEPTDFVIYSGFENEDHCYYRPEYFSPELMRYLDRRIASFDEIWHPLKSYEDLTLELFPSIKCFGLYSSAKVVAQRIEERLGLHVPLIKDPFAMDYYVVQATHPLINKGQALLDLVAITGERGKLIAAGDDYNDLPMFEIADVKVVMATAPQDLLEKADVIAPAASEEGIIIGLDKATKYSKKHLDYKF